ncbi:antitoxin MazE family protein [Pararhizobium sp. O133]|uniref:antitoxin MazE family protein n=1 Tax=Pararhizobium sp. O133 TaxID=3449278 RepID=UPI003F682237
MAKAVNERVQQRRDVMRAAGLRPLQIWVPDARKAGFADECRRQSVLIALAEASDEDMAGFMDAALVDLHGIDE